MYWYLSLSPPAGWWGGGPTGIHACMAEGHHEEETWWWEVSERQCQPSHPQPLTVSVPHFIFLLAVSFHLMLLCFIFSPLGHDYCSYVCVLIWAECLYLQLPSFSTYIFFSFLECSKWTWCMTYSHLLCVEYHVLIHNYLNFFLRLPSPGRAGNKRGEKHVIFCIYIFF